MSSPAPKLFTLPYVSALAPSAQVSDVADIAKTGRLRNQQDDISGLLVFDGCSFVQLVEGPPDGITALLARPARDTRHTNMDVLTFDHTGGERRCCGWDLGYHFVDDDGYELASLRGLREAEALARFDAIRQYVCCHGHAATGTLTYVVPGRKPLFFKKYASPEFRARGGFSSFSCAQVLEPRIFASPCAMVRFSGEHSP